MDITRANDQPLPVHAAAGCSRRALTAGETDVSLGKLTPLGFFDDVTRPNTKLRRRRYTQEQSSRNLSLRATTYSAVRLVRSWKAPSARLVRALWLNSLFCKARGEGSRVPHVSYDPLLRLPKRRGKPAKMYKIATLGTAGVKRGCVRLIKSVEPQTHIYVPPSALI